MSLTRDAMQQQAIDAIDAERSKGFKSTFVQMPTQTGKTRTACKWIRRRLEQSPTSRLMVVAHMGELLDQWGRELTAMNIPYVVEKAEQRAYPKMLAIPSIRVCLASKDSLQKRRLDLWPRDWFDAIHEDEAHLATSTTWRNIHDHFDAFRVGWSATIDRLDGVPLSKVFESKAYTYPIDQAIANGHRVEFRAVACDLSIDLRGIKANTKGDLQPGELEARVGPHLEDLAKSVRKELDKCNVGKAIAFLPSRTLAYAYARFLSAIGVPAQGVCGANPARRTIVETFRQGGFRVLCNNKLLGMGFNDPDIDAVVHLQPTTSRAWFDQMSGRCGATRDGKSLGYLIYPSWESQLDLMGPTDIFAVDASAKVRTVARKLAAKAKDADPKAILDKAREIVAADERREADEARRKLRYQVGSRDVRYKRREYNPIGSVVRACGIDPVRPVARYGLDPQSLGDLDRKLSSLGFGDVPGFSDAAKAELVRFWEDRVDSGMSTFKQCDYLRRRGFDYSRTLAMTVHDAKREIGRLHAGR